MNLLFQVLGSGRWVLVLGSRPDSLEVLGSPVVALTVTCSCHYNEWFLRRTFRPPMFLSSSTAEHPAVNRRVAGSNPA